MKDTIELPEFSFFQLKLQKYLMEHHPDKLVDLDFISSRTTDAEKVYENTVLSGGNPTTAIECANQILLENIPLSLDNVLNRITEEFPGIKEEEQESFKTSIRSSCIQILNRLTITEETYESFLPELLQSISSLILKQSV